MRAPSKVSRMTRRLLAISAVDHPGGERLVAIEIAAEGRELHLVDRYGGFFFVDYTHEFVSRISA